MRTKSIQQSEKMLEAAARLFGTQRFHEVRMEDIAAEAEVGKGTLYRYFDDKEELYLALLARASEQFIRRLREEVRHPTGSRRRLEALVTSIISFFDEHPHLLDLIQRAEVMPRPGAASAWQQARDDVSLLLAQLFAEAKRDGEFVIHRPELAALMLLGGLRSVIRFGKRPRAADLSQQIVAEFLQGAASLPDR